MDDLVDHVFGNYRLIRLLGHGGFARVYLGEHIHLQTQAAIKVLSTQLAAKDIERFRREARTVASLNHPHIVRVFDFGIEQDVPFLVTDYASQGTVQQRHARESRLPLATVLEYMQQIAPALQYAHNRKIIHRDVKPENMLVREQGELLLSDFGIAATTATSTSQQTRTTAGTAAYMAPEQIMGNPCVASDQYALGIVVYSWLSGEHPFQGSFFEICAQHMHAPVPALRQKNPAFPVKVEQCILKALAKDPDQRFASVQEFATALLESASQDLQDAPQWPLPPHTDLESTYVNRPHVASSPTNHDGPTFVLPPATSLTTRQDSSTYVNRPPTISLTTRQDVQPSVNTPPLIAAPSSSIDLKPMESQPEEPHKLK